MKRKPKANAVPLGAYMESSKSLLSPETQKALSEHAGRLLASQMTPENHVPHYPDQGPGPHPAVNPNGWNQPSYPSEWEERMRKESEERMNQIREFVKDRAEKGRESLDPSRVHTMPMPNPLGKPSPGIVPVTIAEKLTELTDVLDTLTPRVYAIHDRLLSSPIVQPGNRAADPTSGMSISDKLSYLIDRARSAMILLGEIQENL